ncbi:MAG: Fpg/Nei family DNA glycosylase [Candidatus Omnitrophica bacterium]|nr:Fpg/Nei family DNA glycosylase [Candidatus Omnitrophota bacterium]
MPELPDVEHYGNYIKRTAARKKITGAETRNAKVLEGVSGKVLAKKLKGKKFSRITRRGKYLLLKFAEEEWLYMHFGMTGDVAYFKKDKEAPKYARVLFLFANGYALAFISQRMLGRIGTAPSPGEFIKKRSLGPDALDVSPGKFKKTLEGRKGALKSALMDQEKIAGIGNIYADEILYASRLHPKTSLSELKDGDIKKIFRSMKRILEKAAEKKADPEKFPRSWLIPQRKKGGKCPRCGNPLRTVKVNGRTSYFCPKSQKRKK